MSVRKVVSKLMRNKKPPSISDLFDKRNILREILPWWHYCERWPKKLFSNIPSPIILIYNKLYAFVTKQLLKSLYSNTNGEETESVESVKCPRTNLTTWRHLGCKKGAIGSSDQLFPHPLIRCFPSNYFLRFSLHRLRCFSGKKFPN
jgi:hypothetical protein